MGAEKCADSCAGRGCKGVAGNGWGEEAAGDERAWLRGRLRTANGWEKKPLVMSELGCADSCGQEMGAENCAVGCGRRGCNGVAGNGLGEEAAGDERARLRGRLRTGNWCGELCGRRGCNGVAGNGWGEEAAGDERAWLRGRLRTANGCGELRGRLRTAWVQRSGWKWVGRSRW